MCISSSHIERIFHLHVLLPYIGIDAACAIEATGIAHNQCRPSIHSIRLWLQIVELTLIGEPTLFDSQLLSVYVMYIVQAGPPHVMY